MAKCVLFALLFTVYWSCSFTPVYGALQASNVNFNDSSSLGTTPSIPPTSAMMRWILFEEKLKKGIKDILSEIRSRFDVDVLFKPVGSECKKDLQAVAEGFCLLKPWAFAMFDASGKMLDGLHTGTLAMVGHYDQCLDVLVHNESDGGTLSEQFRGKYCAINIKPYLPPKPRFYKNQELLPGLENLADKDTIISFFARNAFIFYTLPSRFSACVPSSCTMEDISNVVSIIGKHMNLELKVPWCEVKTNQQKLNTTQTVVISIFGCLVFIALTATAVDLGLSKMKRSPNGVWTRLLLTYSIPRNCKSVFNTSTDSRSLPYLHGLRFITMSWIILGHTYFNVNYLSLRRLKYVTEYVKDPAFQAVVNATVSVDTFFLISGFLLGKLMVQNLLIEKKKFNWKLYIFHRYWRFTPPQLAIIGITFLPIFAPGPLARDATQENVNTCYSTWWANLLYIQNILYGGKSCNPMTWYLAADLQLYLFSLVILLPLVRRPRLGLIINSVSIAVCMFVCGLLTYLLKFPPTMLFVHSDKDQMFEFMLRIYNVPFSHMPAYGVGIFLGYILATRQKILIKPVFQAVGWITAVSCSLAILYGPYEWNNGTEASVGESILYASLHRFGWSLCVAWVIFVCAVGQGGVVNKILSWKAFIPLGRLTFMAYLLHMTLQDYIVARSTLRTASHSLGIFAFFVFLLTTYIAALGVGLLVECPALAMEKLLLKPREKSSEKPVTCHKPSTTK